MTQRLIFIPMIKAYSPLVESYMEPVVGFAHPDTMSYMWRWLGEQNACSRPMRFGGSWIVPSEEVMPWEVVFMRFDGRKAVAKLEER